jgi:hypothetical protein
MFHVPQRMDKADGCDAAIVNSHKFFDSDMTKPDRQAIAINEALRFAWRLKERGVKVVATVSPIAIPVREIRLAFPNCYVSEQCHYVEPIRKDDDIDNPFAIRWAHVWDRHSDYGNASRHQHALFFHNPKANDTDQPDWHYYLVLAMTEVERARDVCVTKITND